MGNGVNEQLLTDILGWLL